MAPAARRGSLRGRTILVTRPRPQAAELASLLRRKGARVIAAPAIRIVPPRSWSRLDRALKGLEGYDTVIFTSANAVERFFRRWAKVRGGKPPQPARLYAIGPGTARALSRRGWRGARLPEDFDAESLARRLGKVRGRRILIPRARVAREVLPRRLRRAGAHVEVVEAYRTVADAAGQRLIRRALRQGGVDAVTFTSASTVSHFLSAAPGARAFLRRVLAASIGPVTSAALRKAGVRRVSQARPYTTAGLVFALEREARLGRL